MPAPYIHEAQGRWVVAYKPTYTESLGGTPDSQARRGIITSFKTRQQAEAYAHTHKDYLRRLEALS